jgi:hypothetical protein
MFYFILKSCFNHYCFASLNIIILLITKKKFKTTKENYYYLLFLIMKYILKKYILFLSYLSIIKQNIFFNELIKIIYYSNRSASRVSNRDRALSGGSTPSNIGGSLTRINSVTNVLKRIFSKEDRPDGSGTKTPGRLPNSTSATSLKAPGLSLVF